MGFLPFSLGFLTVSAASAQTYWTVTNIFILKSLKEKVKDKVKDKGGREYEEGMEDCSGGIDYIIAVFDFF